ncbi:unnamed protein product [Coregonus sp. 'balchen']|nr:unnamed protein product [Coregonus sp. 'balchen']
MEMVDESPLNPHNASLVHYMGNRVSGRDLSHLTKRDLSHLSKRDALRILAAYEHPITLQIKGQLWGHYCSHMSLPRDHRDNGRYEYLPNAPRDIVDMDPLGYQKPLGYLPLHHELDSGLGWTDGSLHQGDLSGLETEEGGLEECHPRGGGSGGGLVVSGGGGGGGGSPSSESFISSELSDSGFYSVSTGEFRRFQRLLEKRMCLYNARLHHQGEVCARERRDSCQKNHRELLEAIPEALTTQPQHSCPTLGLAAPSMGPSPRGLFRVSSVQFRKADRPCLSRHSSSSGSLFNPQHTPGPLSVHAPVLSACSTPSGHHRLPLQHHGSSSVGQLRRSRTLHHRGPPQERVRRASHPSSPSYATLQHCGVAPSRGLELGLPEEGEPELVLTHPAGFALSPQHHATSPGEHRGAVPLPRGHYWDNSGDRDQLGSGGGGGLYSTLEGHIGVGAGVVGVSRMGPNPNPNPDPDPTLNTNPNLPNPNPRAVRNQILRDRASRLADERSGMSTDEESQEVMRGRYWSRTERREHLLLAREQKQQQQQARGQQAYTRPGANGGSGSRREAGVNTRGGVIREGGGGSLGDGRCSTVLELSQKKLSRLRNRKLLDDWTTVEELLTHGTRLGTGEEMSLCPSSLLTVTTSRDTIALIELSNMDLTDLKKQDGKFQEFGLTGWLALLLVPAPCVGRTIFCGGGLDSCIRRGTKWILLRVLYLWSDGQVEQGLEVFQLLITNTRGSFHFSLNFSFLFWNLFN